MRYYVLTDGQEKFIRLDKTSKKYVPVVGEAYATKWDTMTKAENILKSSVERKIRDDYHAEQREIPQAKAEAITNAISQSMISSRQEQLDSLPDGISEWIGKIEEVIGVVSTADEKYNDLNEHLSGIDKKIVDIEHYIEFGRFNAYQGWMCFSYLQKLLQERRVIKNEMTVIVQIRSFGLCEKDLRSLICRISDNACSKIYTPRALPDLFVGKS